MRRLLLVVLLLLGVGIRPAHGVISAPTLLTAETDTSDATSYATDPISPAANSLILVIVVTRLAGTPAEPALSGCSMTWTQMQTGLTSTVGSVSTARLTTFRGTSATPGSNCALTADLGAETQLGGFIYVYQWADAAITGTNGSDGVVQAPATDNEGATAAAGSITLSAFADATNNAAFACWYHAGSVAATAGDGFTLLGDIVSDSRRVTCEYKVGEDTTVDMSWTESTELLVGAAMEIAAASTGQAARAMHHFRQRRL